MVGGAGRSVSKRDYAWAVAGQGLNVAAGLLLLGYSFAVDVAWLLSASRRGAAAG